MTAYPFDVLINSGGIGGNGGGEVSIRADTGGLVERVGVWASGRDIVGVSIKFTNDEEKQQMGSGKWGDFSEFVFESAETVQSLSLWGNGKGTNLGRIKFTTSKGRTFDWGGHDGKQEYPQDVGSGLWVGIKGRCGGTVDLMGVYFLKKVDSMSMKDVKFKNDPTGTSNGIKSKSVKSVQYAWNGKPYEYSFEQPRLDKEVHTVTETNSQTTSLALGMRQQWENKVDLFVEKSTLQVEVSESIEHTWTSEKSTADGTETSDGMTPGAKGSINGPEDAVVVEAITYVGSLDLEYTATIVVKLESGTTYNIPTKGTMKKVAYSKIYLYVRPIDEDSTLPPGENENRSAYDEQVDAGQEETPGYEPTQDDQTAWSPTNEEDDQYNRSWDQKEDAEASEPQQDQEYGQTEEAEPSRDWEKRAENNPDNENEDIETTERSYDQPDQTIEDEQEENLSPDRSGQDREFDNRDYNRMNPEAEEESTQADQDQSLSSGRWDQIESNDNRGNENESEERSYGTRYQEDEEQTLDDQQTQSAEKWDQGREYQDRETEITRGRGNEEEQEDSGETDQWNQSRGYDENNYNGEESTYDRKEQENDERQSSRQANQWNENEADEDRGFGSYDEQDSAQNRFQNDREANYTTSQGQDDGVYGNQAGEYNQGYEPVGDDGDAENSRYKQGYQRDGSLRGYGDEPVY